MNEKKILNLFKGYIKKIKNYDSLFSVSMYMENGKIAVSIIDLALNSTNVTDQAMLSEAQNILNQCKKITGTDLIGAKVLVSDEVPELEEVSIDGNKLEIYNLVVE